MLKLFGLSETLDNFLNALHAPCLEELILQSHHFDNNSPQMVKRLLQRHKALKCFGMVTTGFNLMEHAV